MLQDLQELLKINEILEQQIAASQLVEANLRQSDGESRSLLENALDILSILDNNGIVQYESPSIEGVLGYKPEELVGKNALDLVHPEDAPDVSGTLKHIVQRPGVAQSVQFRYRHKDGSWRVLESIGKTFSGNAAHPLHGTVIVNSRDITERQRLQRLIARAGNYYLTLLEEFPALIWRADLNAKCDYFNKTWLAFTGRTMKQESGDGWREGVHPDDLAASLKTYQEAFAARQPFEMEYRLRRHDGEYRWIVAYGRPYNNMDGNFAGYMGACYDITERKQAQAALQASEERFRTIVTTTREGIWLLDEQAHIIYANGTLSELLGYEWAELQGRTPLDFLDAADHIEAETHFKRCAEGIAEQHDFGFRRKDGSTFWTILSSSPLFDNEGRFIGALGMLTDITQRKQAEQQLVYNALYDELTGLPNRALFRDRLERAFTHAKRHENYLFAVLFLDFDGFKVINDSLGHTMGDQLLVAIAERLQTCLRTADTVARMGGDEFTILLDSIEDLSEATQVAERVQTAMRQPFDLDGQQVFAPVSTGIALYTPSYDYPEHLLRDADTAMYRAKAQGRARYEIFNVDMHAQAMHRLQIENELHRAIEQQEFVLCYQPIVSLATGKITGFEALVRWQHPQRGLLSPLEFVPVAEETGRIVAIDQWVLRTACHQMRRWHDAIAQDKTPLTISINLSSRHFSTPNLVEQVQEILTETGLPSTALKLEITESAIMDNAESAILTLRKLSELGIQLGMDDFGTGYSSLSYLHRFAFDVLKVDRSFISHMTTAERNLEIVQAIVSLANSLRIDVVAEGVETADQLAHLRNLRCEYGQGYFFSKPLDLQSAEALLIQERQW
ncbi:MAG: EAL domain-containing protein [Abitibacteriaceae bacterium]|nr:EAL domain-containing protein [Abditibacteriaceae bacterium]